MLQIRLLGQFDVRLDGKRVMIPTRIAQSLLAYLALTAGTPHRREKLAGTFWPDTTDENARKNLRQELWRIRKAISSGQSAEGDYLLADDLTLKFNREAAYWLDVAQMERPDLDLQALLANLSLYQGELLPGFYDEWITLERERINAIFDARMEALLEGLITAERWIAVQEWGERWLSLSGVREPAYRALMLASAVRGDMAKVASLYQRCTDELQESLGVEPSPETRALYDDLLKRAKIPLRATAAQPSGTITFLFTDIEGSTRLLELMGNQYAVALSEHHEIMRAAIQKWNGREVDTQGDSFFVTFSRALDAVQCAVSAQQALTSHGWPQGESLRVRMGLHTGEPLIASTGYVGMDVHRAARIGDAGHGGQILLSQTTRELIIQDLPNGMTIRDLGEHRLKDMKYPASIYQLVIEGLPSDFAPIRTKFTGSESPTPGEAPFKGLQFFDVEDSDLFFGRETLTAKLWKRLQDAKFLSIIIGASGSGKSSLVRAGLVPVIKKRNANWQVHILTPTAHPLEALAIELTRDSESVTAAATLVDDLSKDPRSLHFFLSRRAQINNGSHTLLVIDQFEELFTLCRDEFEREAFIDNLLTALSPSPDGRGVRGEVEGRITLIITLRADFYTYLAQYPELRDAVAQQQEYIGPMNAEELRLAIEEPARRGHWEFEPGLVDLILRDVGDEPGALPLLSHALLETWKRRAGHMLTLKGYADAGGVHGAIAHTAESLYQTFSPDEQIITRNILLRLTEFGEGTEDTRRRASFDELMSQAADADEVRAVLNRLAEARLVTLGEDSAEVAHEALIREWPQLREWLSQDREGNILHRRLTEAAQEWELLERDAGSVYRGARLAQANEWSALNPDVLNAQERLFLDGSNMQAKREEQEREEQLQRERDAAVELAETQRQSAMRLRTRNRIITSVASIAVILALLAGLFGLRAENEKSLAFSRELAGSAIENLTVDPQRSILLALQALSESYSQQAEAALHQAVNTSRVLQSGSTPGLVLGFSNPAFSPDGTRIVITSCDPADCDNTQQAQVLHAATLETLFTIPGAFASSQWNEVNGLITVNLSDDPNSTVLTFWDDQGKKVSTTTLPIPFLSPTAWMEISPTGKRMGSMTEGGVITIWDLATSQKLQTLHQAESDAYFYPPLFSPDGKYIFVATFAPNKSWLLDIESGQEVFFNPIGGTPAFSPDGKTIAIFSGSVKLFDAASGQKLRELPTPNRNSQSGLKFTPDSRRLVYATNFGSVSVWDTKAEESSILSDENLASLPGSLPNPCTFAISPDNTRILLETCEGQLQLFGISPEYSREWLTVPLDLGSNAVALSPDGTRLAVAGENNTVQIRDADSGQLQLTLTGHTDYVYGMAFSPEGTRLATASWDHTAKVWDAVTGKELLTLVGHAAELNQVAFNPDGKQIATIGYDNTARLWDAVTGRLVFTLDAYSEIFNTSYEIGIAFSPDGRFLATAGRTSLKIWKTASGQEHLNLPLSGLHAASVAFSPDGKRLAVGMASGAPSSVWNIVNATKLFDLVGHTGLVGDIAFSSDGTGIATASNDYTAKVWDATNGTWLLTLTGHTHQVHSLAFSPDGRRLMTVSEDHTLRVWALRLEDLVQIARSRLTRTLTVDECRTYLHVEACPAEP